ncbi:MAG: patatin-like phospholipase family protein [Zetaproteobacteria bacterium]|nr:MAG: patatin-like phospholipase family protein [Zetaproteobacteria bacterium]
MRLWPWQARRPKPGFVLALGGGGGRGLAHIGVFEVLERYALRPDLIVGTSIGALFGAMYALRPEAAWMRREVLTFLASDRFSRLDLPVIKGAEPDESWLSRFVTIAKQTVMYTRAATDVALADVEALYDVARLFTRNADFAALRIPLHLTAVEFPGGECRVFSRKDGVPLDLAIAASMAIPGVFEPVPVAGSHYVDGGLASEIPAREARMLAEGGQLVVAVNVGARPRAGEPPSNVYGMLDWASQIKSLYLRRYEKQYADVLIEPLVAYTQWHDFSHPEQEIAKGAQATEQVLPQLLAALGRA